MIKVEKDFQNIPSILNSKTRKDAFELNIKDKAFNHGKTLYKPDEVKIRLYGIYNLKCAYCEKDIDDEPQHIEHYRPKDIYYWLAYSWDNLLLSCGRCNSSKGTSFKVLNEKVIYNDEPFENIHNLGVKYDLDEKPMIINPEKENILDDIFFNREAIIDSKNKRVKYTIDEACKLNKKSLVKKRIKVVNKLIKSVDRHYSRFQKNNYKGIDRFVPDIETFIEECTKENEFYSFRYFILNNSELFFKNLNQQKIVKLLIKKLMP